MNEWRNNRLIDHEELERMWQLSEYQKPRKEPLVIQYDLLVGWLLTGVAVGAFWAFVYWLYVRFL